MGVTGFLSMWLANVPTTAMMIPIAAAVLTALNDHRMLVREVQRKKRRTTSLALPSDLRHVHLYLYTILCDPLCKILLSSIAVSLFQ